MRRFYGHPGRTGHELLGVVEAVGGRGSHDPVRPAGHRSLRILGRQVRVLPRRPSDLVPHRGRLLDDGLAGRLDPSPVLDLAVGLEEAPAGYAAMHERRAIKVLVRVGAA